MSLIIDRQEPRERGQVMEARPDNMFAVVQGVRRSSYHVSQVTALYAWPPVDELAHICFESP